MSSLILECILHANIPRVLLLETFYSMNKKRETHSTTITKQVEEPRQWPEDAFSVFTLCLRSGNAEVSWGSFYWRQDCSWQFGFEERTLTEQSLSVDDLSSKRKHLSIRVFSEKNLECKSSWNVFLCDIVSWFTWSAKQADLGNSIYFEEDTSRDIRQPSFRRKRNTRITGSVALNHSVSLDSSSWICFHCDINNFDSLCDSKSTAKLLETWLTFSVFMTTTFSSKV